jgi:hypothetical protein
LLVHDCVYMENPLCLDLSTLVRETIHLSCR